LDKQEKVTVPPGHGRPLNRPRKARLIILLALVVAGWKPALQIARFESMVERKKGHWVPATLAEN